MMDLFPRAQLRELIETPDKPCVSIFLPTHRAGVETLQDRIRLKNLVRRASEDLGCNGLKSPAVKKLLQPVRELVKDDWFWRHQSDGLVVFRSEQVYRHYRLPLEFPELSVVADHFHLKPLLPALSGDGHFYILAVSQHRLRLFKGSRHGATEVDLGTLENPQDVLRPDERQLQFHTTAPTGSGPRSAIFHGHGAAEDNNKERLLHYFHQVDEALRPVLQADTAPLVIAGVDYLFPVYQEANTYPHLMKKHVHGNPDNLTAAELHTQGWAIVEPHYKKVQREAAAKYLEMAGTARASHDVETIVPAAWQGRIESLFVSVGTQRWGVFDASTQRTDVHPEAQPGDEDLLNVAAIQTYVHGGAVYALPPAQMPNAEPVAALFRY